MSPSPEMLCFLFFCGGIGGFIDSIAGGGGLITVPALMAAGLPPQLALGTNKAQSSIGTMVAVTRYVRGGLVDWPQVRGAAVVSFLSSAIGAWAVSLISNEMLRAVVPWLLLAIVAYVMFSPKLGEHSGQARLKAGAFGLIFGSTLGFYDGFFGPGTGSFFMLAFVMLAGFGMLKATAHTKLLNFASNIGSLAVFIPLGVMWWGVGIAMGLAQMAGATLGARMAMRVGARLIKPLIVVVSVAMALRLLWQALG